ncbi:hypothetical protein CWO90_38490 [Bradyrhizobium sp. Leo121]|nr:hypothetical protein CWO90_38490 [Bradyrhizobium sp. Leo121]
MPASPASMIPSGAIRSISPGGASGIAFRAVIPAPELGTFGDSVTAGDGPSRDNTKAPAAKAGDALL